MILFTGRNNKFNGLRQLTAFLMQSHPVGSYRFDILGEYLRKLYAAYPVMK
jgi:hypothetical protein